MRGVISIVGGFLLMFPLGWLFGEMNWPIFHSWGLMHGSFVIAWPVLALLVYVVFRLFVRSGAK
jgi:hypothetical protein